MAAAVAFGELSLMERGMVSLWPTLTLAACVVNTVNRDCEKTVC